jgi:phage gpG-like protein
MMTIALDGADALQARFAGFPTEMLDSLSAKTALLAQALAHKVRDDKLTGGVLNVASGALRASIVAEVGVDASGVFASVGSVGDVKYAAIHEYGGKTAAHEIVALKAEALAFANGGAMVFARCVAHPGSTIPERSYLRSSLAEMVEEIIAALAESPREALEQS